MNKHIRLIQAFALGMAVLSLPTLATAATTLSVVDPAHLVSKGVGALVSVEVTCDPSFSQDSLLFLSVMLFQRAGNRVTQGSGSINNNTINCDGTPQAFEILVLSSEIIFRQGPAIAQGFAQVCDPSFTQPCEFAQVLEEIELVRQ